MGDDKLHALALATHSQVVIARTRFIVADVSVAWGQKYGLRIVSSMRLFSFAFFPSFVTTSGYRHTLPSAIASNAYTMRQTREAMSTFVGLVSSPTEVGTASKTMHPKSKIKADMEYSPRWREVNRLRE